MSQPNPNTAQEQPKPTETPAPTPTPQAETAEQLHDAAIAAVEAWEKTPTPEAKASAKTAVEKAKAAHANVAKEHGELKSKVRVVPEKYDLKLPQGSTLDATHLEKVASFAKEHGLSQKEADALVLRDSEFRNALTEAQAEENKKAIEALIPMAKADPEIGGDNFERKVSLASRLVKRVDTDGKIAKELNESGMGNHPLAIRLLSRIAEIMGEDQLVPAPSSAGGQKTRAQILYGDEPENENKGE